MFNDDFTGFRFKNTGLDPQPVTSQAPTARAEFSTAYQTVKRLAASDGALMDLFQELLMLDGIEPKKRLTAPMPLDPAAIQVSVWDNWLGDTPRKSKPHRYGVTIKVWNDARIDFKNAKSVSRTGTATLMDPKALAAAAAKARLKKGNLYPISDAYAAMLITACEVMTEMDRHGGMLVTRPPGEGTLRHDRQMVMADTAAIGRGDLDAECVIWVNEETYIKMPRFSDRVAAGMSGAGSALGSHVDARTEEVTSRCIMQSRYSRDPDLLTRWTTS